MGLLASKYLPVLVFHFVGIFVVVGLLLVDIDRTLGPRDRTLSRKGTQTPCQTHTVNINYSPGQCNGGQTETHPSGNNHLQLIGHS